MKILLALTILMICYSCDLIRLLNTSKEKNETTDEINLFLSKNKYKFDYSFENIDSTAKYLRSPKYRINDDSLKYSYIQLRIFDHNGYLYSGYSLCMGNFDNRKILDSFPPKKNTYPMINNELTLKNEFNLLYIDENKRSEILTKSKYYKYTFVVYWTIWTNYFSKHLLKEVSKIKTKFSDDVLVVLVNLARDTN